MERLEGPFTQESEDDIRRAALAELSAEAHAMRSRVRSKITKALAGNAPLVEELHPQLGVIFSSPLRNGAVFTAAQIADHRAWREEIARQKAMREEARAAKVKAKAAKQAAKAAGAGARRRAR